MKLKEYTTVISAHGATVTVTNEAVTISPTPLAASLRGSAEPITVALGDVRDVATVDGDAWTGAIAVLTLASGELTIPFAPGDTSGPGAFAQALVDARRGDAPADTALDGAAGIPGFSFVALDVETANQQWGSICQIGMSKVIDGEEVERVSWLCCPPPGMDEFDPYNVKIHGISRESVADSPCVGDLVDKLVEFVGDLPVVAHNAQFDASALRSACIATGREVPPVMFACSLAQARATKLEVQNHRLPTLAEHFGVALDNHHDAAADAAACAGIMMGLARQAAHEGSLMSFVHNTGFALGAITAQRVTPVLRDRSGATRALQAQRVAEGGLAAAVEATAAPRGSNQAGPSRARRGSGQQALDFSAQPQVDQPQSDQSHRDQPQAAAAQGGGAGSGRSQAPWQAVATPDTVPEPNPQADPNSPLYGEHVTLTGDFEPYDKGELWSGIADAGGQVGKNVTKKTTILVTGEWATMTSKEKRARELMDKGQDIQIWTAAQLLEALGLG